jgi:hypothetical protein
MGSESSSLGGALRGLGRGISQLPSMAGDVVTGKGMSDDQKRIALMAGLFAGGVGAANYAGSSMAAGAGGAAAPTTSYGVGGGNIGNLGLAGSTSEAGLASTTAGTVGSGVGTEAATTAGSWGPYASAGAGILSSLFTGLMQMEQQKEQQEYERRMMIAKSKVEREQAKNAALDRLIQVWGAARR